MLNHEAFCHGVHILCLLVCLVYTLIFLIAPFQIAEGVDDDDGGDDEVEGIIQNRFWKSLETIIIRIVPCTLYIVHCTYSIV